MLRKLEVDAAQADLAAVEGMLARRSRQADPVGWLQFSKRKETLQRQISELQTQVATGASLALFFGGLPVFGSRGIKAEFGAKAIDQFQDVVTKRFAEFQGPIGFRGPTKQADQTGLMITDIARGSFGFVLEELSQDHLVESPLKHVVDDVIDLIYQTSAPDEEAFDSFMEAVDPRVLASLRSFFQILDSEGATMRIVEDQREFSLPREAIARARSRTDTIEITETETLFDGKFYLLPESKKFELHLKDGVSIRGSVAAEFLKALIGEGAEVPEGILGTERSLIVRVRTVKIPNAPIKHVYRLLSLADPEKEEARRTQT
jgi:hypothetical protein